MKFSKLISTMARDQRDYSSAGEDANGLVNGVKKIIITNGDGSSAQEATPATTASADNASNVEDDPVEVGMLCDLKKLYSGKEDKHGRFVWQDSIPEDIGSPVENSETAKYALLVRNVRVYK
jgi:hypothetical protein